jgi:hypothetical protein
VARTLSAEDLVFAGLYLFAGGEVGQTMELLDSNFGKAARRQYNTKTNSNERQMR